MTRFDDRPPPSTRFTPLGALALTAALVILLAVPISVSGRGKTALVDLVHAPAFAIYAFILIEALRPWLPRRPLLAGVLMWVIASGFGAATEAAQAFIGRGSSLQDAMANMLGAAAGIAWWRSQSIRVRYGLRAVALVILLTAQIRPLSVIIDRFRQWRDMPVVASFEHPGEMSRWSAQAAQFRRVRRHATHGTFALEVELDTAKYPGVQMDWPPYDWSPYRELTFDVYLDGDRPLDLIVKIHDLRHWEYDRRHDDRFHQRLHLKPGSAQVQILLDDVKAAPRTREMDLDEICFVQFYTVKPDEPQRFYLDHIRLR